MTDLSRALEERLDKFHSYLKDLPLELGREPSLFPEFRRQFEYHLRQCEEITTGQDRRTTSLLQQASWRHVGHPRFLEAPVNWRAFHKPRGYAGDGELLDMFQRAGYEGSTALGRLIHRVSMLQPAALAVRNRVELVRAGMEATFFTHGVASRFLSMGCGTAPELKRLTTDHPYWENPEWRWVGVDVDPETVEVCRVRHLDPRLSFDTTNPLDLSRNPDQWRWGEFDFIYAVGLFDYFPTGTAQNLVLRMFEHLRPGGHLLVGNFHPRNPTRWYMEYIAKWHLLHRSEDELAHFAGKLPPGQYTLRVITEPAQAQIFIDIERTL